MDIPREFVIREGNFRIHNPIDAVKLATLGSALHLEPGMKILDLACGSGEMLCTWARDYGITGTGVDLSVDFLNCARLRAGELGVSDQVRFEHGNASGYVADVPVDVASCLGATWIGGGYLGTLELLEQSLKPGGIALIGEPFWLQTPTPEALRGVGVFDPGEYPASLGHLVTSLINHRWDVVEMVLADKDTWDRYVAPQWLNIRRWLDDNPDDDLWDQMREELERSPLNYILYQREFLGWGVFAVMRP